MSVYVCMYACLLLIITDQKRNDTRNMKLVNKKNLIVFQIKIHLNENMH